MPQTAVRTLLANNETDPVKFLAAINETIYQNVQRMNTDKSMTLSLFDYQDSQFSLSGQHEEVIIVRNGKVELIDTSDLGFPIGFVDEIGEYVAQTKVPLICGDVVVLYTDGITEAANLAKEEYGIEPLCKVIELNWQKSADEIRQAVVEDVRQYIG